LGSGDSAAPTVLVDPEDARGGAVGAINERLARLWAQLAPVDLPLSHLRVLSEDEHEALVVAPNRTRAPYPSEDSLGRLFLASADRNPHAPAARFRDETITYGVLRARAQQVAGGLWNRGVRPGDAVIVFGERSMEALTAIVGVVLAGAVYVPLSPEWPLARRQQIRAAVQARAVVLCQAPGPAGEGREAARPDFDPGPDLPVLTVAEALATASPFTGDDERCGGDRLYVLFTSGSTGVPKGVEITHRGVARLVFDRTLLPVTPGRAVMHAAPLTFDASTKEIWLPLLNGGVVSGFEKEEVLSAGAFQMARRTRPVDTAFFTTTLFETLLDQDPAVFRGIDRICVGGEVLRPGVAARALALPDVGCVVNVYGPTETTVYALAHVLRPEDAQDDIVPIGRPIANTTAYVLDCHKRPVAPEGEGELYIGGAGVALGYLGDPQSTADRFLPDPFSAEGGRLYRTGDRVRIRADGVIEFLGRVDDQVKIRGYRIEPGEIETVLQALPGLERAVVRVWEPQPGDRRLVAWVKAEPDLAVADEAAFLQGIEKALRERLPEHMIPSRLVRVAAFPATPHGKVDVKALSVPFWSSVAADRIDRDEPLPGVLGLLRRVLMAPDVNVDSEFLKSGGDSLMAVRLAREVHRLCGVMPPVSLFFEPETPRAIAAYVRLAAWRAETGREVGVDSPESSAVKRF